MEKKAGMICNHHQVSFAIDSDEVRSVSKESGSRLEVILDITLDVVKKDSILETMT